MEHNRFYPWLLRQVTRVKARYVGLVALVGYVAAFVTVSFADLTLVNTLVAVSALIGMYFALLVYARSREAELDEVALQRSTLFSRWAGLCFGISFIAHIFIAVIGVEEVDRSGMLVVEYFTIGAVLTVLLIQFKDER